MKRFTSLMLTLLFAVTTFAQTLPATDKSFTITTNGRGGLAANDAATACVGFNHTAVASEEQKNFAFIQYDGNVYLYNVWAKKFMQKDGSLTTALPIDSIQVTNLDGGAYFFKYDDTHVVNLGGSYQLTIDSWGGTWGSVDAGNTFTLTEVDTFDPTEAIAVLDNSCTITYDFQYNGETIGTQTTTVEKGAAYPAIDTTQFPFGFTATIPTGTVDADTEKTIELTAAFSWADSYENITAWYYLDLKDGKYLFYEEGQTNIPLTKTAVDSNNKDAYSWGFIGDPVNGFQIVNLAAGNAMILSSTTDTSDGNTGGSTYPVMTAMPVPEGNNTHWVFTASTYRTDGFYIGQKDNASNRLNNRDSKLAYWTGGADAGSTFLMTERDMTGAAELQELVDGVDAVSENYQGAIGTAVGNLTEESVNAVASALAAAKSILALDDRTTDQITSAHVALQEAIDALATVQPTEGKFYTIASACTGTREGKMIYVNTAGGMNFNTAGTDLGYLFQFEAAGDGKFYMYNVAKDRYLSTANAHGYGQEQSLAEETTGAKKVTIKNLGLENVVGLWPEGGAMIHAQDANSVVVAWNNEENNNGSAWRIVEVEDPTTTSFDLTIGEAGYATLYLGCAVTIPEGVEAYAVSEVDEWAVLSPVTGAIPANEAVILKKAEGQPTDDTTYKFNYAESATAVETNLLGGTTVDTYIAGPAYVLGNVDGVGLYKAVLNADATGAAAGEQTHFKNNAHKAYLLATDGALTAASYSFRFGEGTTGIENVVTENGAKAIFDLTGRRVEAISAPGIYIVNGKKVLVK